MEVVGTVDESPFSLSSTEVQDSKYPKAAVHSQEPSPADVNTPERKTTPPRAPSPPSLRPRLSTSAKRVLFQGNGEPALQAVTPEERAYIMSVVLYICSLLSSGGSALRKTCRIFTRLVLFGCCCFCACTCVLSTTVIGFTGHFVYTTIMNEPTFWPVPNPLTTLNAAAMQDNSTISIWIHGLNSSAASFHINRNGKMVNWGQAFLLDEFPQLGIYTWEYQNPVLNLQHYTQFTLETRAQTLLQYLDVLIGESRVKIIFVCHSYGGLLAKEAYVQAATSANPAFYHLYEKTKGFIFMGVPHRGSPMRRTTCLRLVYGLFVEVCDFLLDSVLDNFQATATEELDTNNPRLLALDKRFVETAAHTFSINVVEKSAMPNTPIVVVPESAATMGFNETARYSQHQQIYDEGDHIQVSKLSSKGLLSYLKAAELIRRVIQL